MAQAQLTSDDNSKKGEIQIIALDENTKRKVNLCMGDQHYISVFQNENNETFINIRKGTRSITISKAFFSEICDLRETIILCCSFVDGDNTQKQ